MSRSSKAARLLRLEDAATELGWTGSARRERLKRLIFARENELGHTFAIRLKGPRRTGYRVTMGALRCNLPELFPSKISTLAGEMRELVGNLSVQFQEKIAQEVANATEPRLDELYLRQERIAEEMSKLVLAVQDLQSLSKVRRPR